MLIHCVVADQFGAIDIDSELVAFKESLEGSDQQIMMLNNGCLCCTVKDDLLDMLKSWSDSLQLATIL